MVWELNVKSFKCEETGDNFVAIVPVFAEYKHNNRPINHIRITGVCVSLWMYHNDNGLSKWHPENPFSLEKWIEVDLYLCKWKSKQEEYAITERTRIGWFGENTPALKFFVSAIQLQPLHWTVTPKYRSTDREMEECGGTITQQKEYYVE